MLHNAVQTVADCYAVDGEQIVYKIYSYFSIHTVRVTQLEEFNSFVDVEYHRFLVIHKHDG